MRRAVPEAAQAETGGGSMTCTLANVRWRIIRCEECRGTGTHVRRRQDTIGRNVTRIVTACQPCDGRGYEKRKAV